MGSMGPACLLATVSPNLPDLLERIPIYRIPCYVSTRPLLVRPRGHRTPLCRLDLGLWVADLAGTDTNRLALPREALESAGSRPRRGDGYFPPAQRPPGIV